MSALGVIPARGGSKGIPGKNLAPLGGIPLLLHTIRCARDAASLSALVVSTDSDEVADVAAEAGVEVVERPVAIAGDDSTTEEALLHVLDVLEQRGDELPDYVVTLEPTSPLRSARLVDECVELAEREHANAVITVAETRENYGRLVGGRFEFLLPGQPRRRQEREPLYRESSTVYVTRTDYLRRSGSVLAEPLYAVIAPPEETIDINDPLDLVLAEAVLAART
jgi:CMP-N,N'-diacetyllegionaminic acid synthase